MLGSDKQENRFTRNDCGEEPWPLHRVMEVDFQRLTELVSDIGCAILINSCGMIVRLFNVTERKVELHVLIAGLVG